MELFFSSLDSIERRFLLSVQSIDSEHQFDLIIRRICSIKTKQKTNGDADVPR